MSCIDLLAAVASACHGRWRYIATCERLRNLTIKGKWVDRLGPIGRSPRNVLGYERGQAIATSLRFDPEEVCALAGRTLHVAAAQRDTEHYAEYATKHATQRADHHQLTHDLLAGAAEASESERRRLIDEVVLLNLGLAESIARRYSGRGIEHDDLVQVACLGLVNAARRFNPRMGKDFISFAVPTITGEVKRYFRDHGWTVRPPRRVQELHAALSAATAELAQQQGAAPSTTDLATHLGLDPSDVAEASTSHECFNVASIDYRGTDGDDTPLAEAIGDHDADYDRTEAIVAMGCSVVPQVVHVEVRPADAAPWPRTR